LEEREGLERIRRGFEEEERNRGVKA